MEERVYLKDQRMKCGPKGSFQLGTIDKSWLQKDQKKQARKQETEISTCTESELPGTSGASPSHSISSAEVIISSDSDFVPEASSSTAYNLIKTPRFAMELVRGDISSRLGATLANALLLDFQDADLLKLDQSLPINTFFWTKIKLVDKKNQLKV